MAALSFSFDTLKTGGHFLCKFYQGSEEKAFETKLKRMFAKVSREKPDSSRSVGVGGWRLAVVSLCCRADEC
jgi:21S rRNA (uridine2791-2'-O)-methyltransferase